MPFRRTGTTSVAVSGALLVSLGLAGCVAPGEMPNLPPSVSPSSSSPGEAPPALSPSPSPSLDQGEPAVPVSIPCTSVISAQSMYDFGPNFALVSSFTPPSSSLAARAAASSGTVCRWVNETSGEAIDVSIAKPSSVDFESLLAQARAGTPVPRSSGETFFSSVDGAGTAQSFQGRYWITVGSVYFGSADDLAPLLDEALSAAR